MSITPIQQLLSAQRIADVQIQSNQIFKNLSIVSRLAGSLSNGNSIDIIDAFCETGSVCRLFLIYVHRCSWGIN